MTNLAVVSTKSSRYFAELLANQLNAEIIDTERKNFPDGENYLRISIEERNALLGRDIIIVGSTHTDSDFNEIVRVGTAAAKCGAKRIIFVIPFFGYSTMERAQKPGEVVTAKINARILSQIPSGETRNCFFMLDLHTYGLVHYFEGNVLSFELYAESVLIKAIAELNLDNFMLASADLGRPKWVETFANIFNTQIAFIRKSRNENGSKVEDVIGDVGGKNVIIYDDMVRSGDSIIHAAEAYISRDAKYVYAVLSHLALYDQKAIEKLLSSQIVRIIATNSHPMSQHAHVRNSSRFNIVDVSRIFTDSIRDIFKGA